jgi:hypothetical protein
VRAIVGVDIDIAVAALLIGAPGAPTQDRGSWLLLSPDPDLAADPWSDGDLKGAILPEP